MRRTEGCEEYKHVDDETLVYWYDYCSTLGITLHRGTGTIHSVSAVPQYLVQNDCRSLGLRYSPTLGLEPEASLAQQSLADGVAPTGSLPCLPFSKRDSAG